MRLILTLRTTVIPTNVQLIIHVQLTQNARQLLGTVKENNLLERSSRLGNVLRIVVAQSQIKYIPLIDPMTDIPIINIFVPANHIPYTMTGQMVRLNPITFLLNILNNHGLRSLSCHSCHLFRILLPPKSKYIYY